MNFKVGDKVICTYDAASAGQLKVGNTYTVKSYDGEYCLYVEGADCNYGSFSESRFKPVPIRPSYVSKSTFYTIGSSDYTEEEARGILEDLTAILGG